MKRVLSLVPVFVAVALFACASAFADDKNKDQGNAHEGKVVSVTGNKLVMTDSSGKNEHTMTVSDSARVSCDGKDCKLTDLKPGQRIRVTSAKNNKDEAMRIEALDKNNDFGKSASGSSGGKSGDKNDK